MTFPAAHPREVAKPSVTAKPAQAVMGQLYGQSAGLRGSKLQLAIQIWRLAASGGVLTQLREQHFTCDAEVVADVRVLRAIGVVRLVRRIWQRCKILCRTRCGLLLLANWLPDAAYIILHHGCS